MKTSDVLTNHLISSMERRGDGWGIKNIESRFIYANKLGTYSCVVEQIIRQICNKIDIYTRKQLRDYSIAEGFDNYFPPCLLKGLL